MWGLFSSTPAHTWVQQDATTSSGTQAYGLVLVSRFLYLALTVYIFCKMVHNLAIRMVVAMTWGGSHVRAYVQGSMLLKATLLPLGFSMQQGRTVKCKRTSTYELHIWPPWWPPHPCSCAPCVRQSLGQARPGPSEAF